MTGREATDVKWCGRAPAYRCIYLDEGEAEPCELHAQEGRQTTCIPASEVETDADGLLVLPVCPIHSLTTPVGREATLLDPHFDAPEVLPHREVVHLLSKDQHFQGATVWCCKVCGSLVYNLQAHAGWHKENDRG